MRTALVTAAAVVVLAVGAPPALAGCWATVGISPPARDAPPGTTWTVDVHVLQHGRTPLADATPAVVLTNPQTGEERRFPARPTTEVGTYRAEVVYPAAARWAVAVDDGFPWAECAHTHTFGTVASGRRARRRRASRPRRLQRRLVASRPAARRGCGRSPARCSVRVRSPPSRR